MSNGSCKTVFYSVDAKKEILSHIKLRLNISMFIIHVLLFTIVLYSLVSASNSDIDRHSVKRVLISSQFNNLKFSTPTNLFVKRKNLTFS